MSGLLDKLKKNSTIKETETVEKSKFFNKKDMIPTQVPAMNIALSGSIDGGLTPGLTVFAGPSKNFKSGFSLMLAKTYMDKYPDSILLFYDSEFGMPKAYFDSFDIDTSRVLHTPIMNMEQLKFDIVHQLENLDRGERVVIVLDSLGNTASRKEIQDALEEKSVADMTRAKQVKSLFRMVTPYLNIRDIPMICVAHTYQTQELYSKAVVSGGTGTYYSADTIFILGRQQEKEGTDVVGYNFVINVEKSRYVKEKSKIPIEVSFGGGISKWSGLLDIALDTGHVIKPSNGWYSKVDTETGEVEDKKYRIKDTYNKEFWMPVISSKSFQDAIEKKYRLSTTKILSDDEIAQEIENSDIDENHDE